MFRTDGGPQRYEFPGDEPQTVAWYRPLGQEDDLLLGTQLERVKRGESMLGREADDPSTVRKMAATERGIIAGLIDRLENVDEPGDVVTDKDKIEAFLKAIPARWFYLLKAEMSAGLTLFVGKA